MEFQDLPPLRTKLNKEIPSATLDQINFLWKACGGSVGSDINSVSPTSHRLCQSFIEAVKVHKIDLPLPILERFCGNCSVLLIPSVTSQVRVRARTRKSKVNRAKTDKVKNQLVLRCKLCQHICKMPGNIKKQKVPVLSSSINGKSASSVPSSGNGSVTSNSAVKPDKKKFSFLNKLQPPDRRSSAPGKLDNSDFISFSSSAASSVANSGLLSQTNRSGLQALSRGILGGGKRDFATTHSNTAKTTGTLNLLELEALNKRKKKMKASNQ